MKIHETDSPSPRRSFQFTLRGLFVLVAEAALVSAALAELPPEGAVQAVEVAIIPLLGALWGALRDRSKLIGAFRGGVFAGAGQSALFALWRVGLLLFGRFRPVGATSVAVAAFEIAVVLVTSLFLGAILGFMVGVGLRMAGPPPQRTPELPSRAHDPSE